jgi:nitrite reductase/ring-hydroxylating ferredoxin subunit
VAEEALEWVVAECVAPEESRTAAAVVRGLRLVLCRAGGQLFALDERCPHASEPLSGGALRGYALECPYHGGRLDVRDGRPLAAPIRRPARTWPVREAGGRVEIGIASADAARRTTCTSS